MKSLTRRNFNTLTAKGIGGAALLSSAPFAYAMGNNQDKNKLGMYVFKRIRTGPVQS